ncbi:MAG: molybdopterin molybdotransferase MoeA [Cyclobacteriaceae bacterium]
MISAKEASDIVMSKIFDWGKEIVPVSSCYGKVLREDVFADRDFPPYDRVTMDGIAVKADDFIGGRREFEVIGMQTAGEEQKTLAGEGSAMEIMTGAILPKDADAVVRYEDIEILSDGEKKIARLHLDALASWKNVHKKGTDRKKGDCLIRAGRVLSASDVAVLATVGKDEVQVSRMPKVAIISTGDELVEVGQTPLSHQIRMSNSVMIQTKLNELGVPNSRIHLRDDYDELVNKIEDILDSHDVLILSGGVSKGKADYVPEVLHELKVKKLFHRVAQRPGKPFWFGEKEGKKFVFALPGNPVSTFMCFVVYFLPWLRASLKAEPDHGMVAVLNDNFKFRPDLTYFLQVDARINEEGVLLAMPKEGGGSGDLSNLVRSNGFLELPPDRLEFEKGDRFKIHLFRNS